MSRHDAYAQLIQRRAGLALALLAAIVVGALALLPQLKIESGLGVFHQKDDVHWREMRRVDEHFVNDDLLVIGYQTDAVFSHDRLVQLRALGNDISRIELPAGADKRTAFAQITSLATVDDLIGSELSFRNSPLVPDPVPRDEARLAQIRRRARANPVIRANLLSFRREDVALLFARFTPGLDDRAHNEAIAQVRVHLRRAAHGTPTRYFLAGQAVADADTATYQSDDLGRFIPIVFALMFALLLLFLRRVSGTLVAVTIMLTSLLVAVSLLAAIGSSINNCSAMLPPVIATLATALLLHYFSELGKNRLAGHDGPQLVRRTVGELLTPVVMGAVTTGIGFASLSVSQIPAVREFGVAAGLGMLTTFVITTMIFVLASTRMGPERLVAEGGVALSPRFHRVLALLAERVIRHRVAIVIGGLLFGGLTAAGASRVVVDMDPIAIFPPRAPIRRASVFIDDNLGGSTVIVAAIKGPQPQYFATPEGLRQIEALERFMRSEVGTTQTTSVVDFIKLMHREFFNGDARYWAIPPTKEAIAQLLLLNSDRRIDESIDGQRQWVRIVGRARQVSTMALKARFDALEAHLAAHFPRERGFETYATGHARMTAEMTVSIMKSLSASLLVSGTLITLLFLLLFRSPTTGLIAALPNLLPVAGIFGLMGWAGIKLDAATVMTTTVALGIAVDDTIHFIQQMRLELARHGDHERAVRETFRVKGPAIVWTSLVIATGFSVLLISSFAPTRNFGILISTAMIVALMGDILFLPAILLWTKTKLGVRPAAGAR